ncbi:MAG: hypothetical protein FD163_1675 [Hyphomonadaceae bacterium]|nr:MAG: hypothetical protein FD163_1675 [Hyphomonadaceae bacterium]
MCYRAPRRDILLSGLALGFLTSCSAGPKINLPSIVPNKSRDIFLDYYNAAMGVNMAQFTNTQIVAIDGIVLKIRIASPVQSRGHWPIIIFCPDLGTTAQNYDNLTGAIASLGYLVIIIDPQMAPSRNSVEAILRRNTLRAQYMRFALDRKTEILRVLGDDDTSIDFNSMGAIGHGDGAWTALELIGWGRGYGRSLDMADARIKAAVGITPTIAPNYQARPANAVSPAIYGRGMVVNSYDGIARLPHGTALMGLGLPLSSPSFGNLLPSSQPSAASRGEKYRKETLSACIATSSMFFDWCLKNQRDRIDELNQINGRSIPLINQNMIFGRS